MNAREAAAKAIATIAGWIAAAAVIFISVGMVSVGTVFALVAGLLAIEAYRILGAC